MKRLREIIRIIDLKQIIDFLLFPFIWFISLFFKPFYRKIWIIEENPNEACDNGYVFFQYLRMNHKDIDVYYVIYKNSKDYSKVHSIGNTLEHGSLKHWIYYLNADKIIVSQKYANPSPALFHILHKYQILKTPRIFLQHGIIKDDCKMFYYERTKFRLFICGAKREYEYIDKNYHYPFGYVVYTGLARYDKLNIPKENHRSILIYPTWRNYIHNQNEFDLFMNHYYSMIEDSKLLSFLEKKDITIHFVLHKNMKKYQIHHKNISSRVYINHNDEVDIQDLIHHSNLLITDFSSLFFDFAYQNKPIIYYQFDREEYRQQQLPEGYFSYLKDGFGDVFDDYKDVIRKIEYYVEHHFKVEEKYFKRSNIFFERRDINNCERIFEEILKIDK